MEAMGYPWFRERHLELGGYKKLTGEDVAWCIRAKEKGFKMHVDMNVRLGHQKNLVVRADYGSSDRQAVTASKES
jgi:hypothetical protein